MFLWRTEENYPSVIIRYPPSLFFCDTHRLFVISVIVVSLEGGNVEFKQLKEIETKDFTQETISLIYMGLTKLLKCALKLPHPSLKQEVRFFVVVFSPNSSETQ